jgi:SNF2 family DNA or RNA helicase
MDILDAYLRTSPAITFIQAYHGGLTDIAKEEVLKASHQPLGSTHQILLLQLQSGGVGLNLQHFTKIVFLSPWWTVALMDQAVGRAVRIGQAEIVEVTMLILKEEGEGIMNIDEMMLEKIEAKRGILDKLFSVAARGIGQVGAQHEGLADEEEEEDPI